MDEIDNPGHAYLDNRYHPHTQPPSNVGRLHRHSSSSSQNSNNNNYVGHKNKHRNHSFPHPPNTHRNSGNWDNFVNSEFGPEEQLESFFSSGCPMRMQSDTFDPTFRSQFEAQLPPRDYHRGKIRNSNQYRREYPSGLESSSYLSNGHLINTRAARTNQYDDCPLYTSLPPYKRHTGHRFEPQHAPDGKGKRYSKGVSHYHCSMVHEKKYGVVLGGLKATRDGSGANVSVTPRGAHGFDDSDSIGTGTPNYYFGMQPRSQSGIPGFAHSRY